LGEGRGKNKIDWKKKTEKREREASSNLQLVNGLKRRTTTGPWARGKPAQNLDRP